MGGSRLGFRLAGKKRAHEDSDDIVKQLEQSAVEGGFLASKRERKEAVLAETAKTNEQETQRKRSNFKRAFDRVKERQKMLDQDESDAFSAQIALPEDDYELVQNQLEKQRQLMQRKKKDFF